MKGEKKSRRRVEGEGGRQYSGWDGEWVREQEGWGSALGSGNKTERMLP